MKKFFVVFSLVLSIFLISFYHIDSYAIDKASIVIHTKSSVSGFASGDYATYLNACYTSVIPNDFYDHIDSLPSEVNSFDHFVCFGDGSNSLYLFCFDAPANSDIGMIYADFYPDTDFGSNPYYWKVPSKVVPDHYLCLNFNYNAGVWAPSTSSFSIVQEGLNFYDINSVYKNYIYDTDLYLVCDRQGTMSNLFQNNAYENEDNLSSSDLPYIDSDGSVVDPSVQFESNANHMYFQNCDLGFCEPTDIKNFTSFGGAYLYCKYSLDNWVINHINDYQLQFNVVAAIGSEQNNFTYTMRVDRNGFVTIPFSYIFQSESPSAIPINRGFAAVVTNQKLGADYNIAHLYSVANSNVPNFIRTLGAEYNYNLTDLGWSALKGGTLKYLCAWVSDGGTISMNNLAEWSDNVAQSFNPYILRVNVKLVAGDYVSGDYAEKFDLYSGDQSTVDTGGLVNNDPFVPDVDQQDGDLPELPQDPNSTTPSTIVYTGGSFTGNFNGVIGFDPGYRELKQDLDSDPDDNFTQYLAPFKNNEVGGFVGDFLDDMPTALKSIFIGGFGVLTLLGIYRFIRRG